MQIIDQLKTVYFIKFTNPGMVSMAQSVDLSIATVIEHVGKNCVSQTKSLLCRVRFPGRWKITTSGMLENDPSRPLAPNCNHFSIFFPGNSDLFFSLLETRAKNIRRDWSHFHHVQWHAHPSCQILQVFHKKIEFATLKLRFSILQLRFSNFDERC